MQALRGREEGYVQGDDLVVGRKPQAVLISLDEYRALTHADEQSLGALTGEFDAMFERMQAPGAAAAMQKAFDTPPAKLGALAVAAAGAAKAKRRKRG